MLYKSVTFNLQISCRSFYPAIVAAMFSGILYVLLSNMFLINMLVLLIGAVVSVVYCLKGMNMLFNKSIFDEGSAFYMTLPMPEKYIVLGKISAAAIYISLCTLIYIAALAVSFFVLQIDGASLFSSMLENFPMWENMSPAAVGIYTSFLPLRMLVENLTGCALLLSLMLFFHAKNIGGRGKNASFAWIVYFMFKASDSKISGLSGLWEEAVLFAAQLALLVILVCWSTKMLKTQYNQ